MGISVLSWQQLWNKHNIYIKVSLLTLMQEIRQSIAGALFINIKQDEMENIWSVALTRARERQFHGKWNCDIIPCSVILKAEKKVAW